MTSKILDRVIEVLEKDTESHDNKYALELLNKIKVWNNIENQRVIDVETSRYFYDDDERNKGPENRLIKFHKVETPESTDMTIGDDGGITEAQLRHLIYTVQKTPLKIKSIVFDWDKTFTCTEGLGIESKEIYTTPKESMTLANFFRIYKEASATALSPPDL